MSVVDRKLYIYRISSKIDADFFRIRYVFSYTKVQVWNISVFVSFPFRSFFATDFAFFTKLRKTSISRVIDYKSSQYVNKCVLVSIGIDLTNRKQQELTIKYYVCTLVVLISTISWIQFRQIFENKREN